MKQVNISIPPHLREIADKKRTKRAESLAAYIRRLIAEDGERKRETA